MILRLLNIQGIAGIALSLALGIMLAIQKGETHHWKKESASFEQLYHQDQAAFATTVANYRSAADQARAADQANWTGSRPNKTPSTKGPAVIPKPPCRCSR